MRALGDQRRKAPVENKKAEESIQEPKAVESTPAEQLDSFDESVVIN